jgi:hypothetical protein
LFVSPSAASVFPLCFRSATLEYFKINFRYLSFPYNHHRPHIPTPFAMLSSLLPTIVALYFISFTAVRGSPCVVFDVKWNLLAFGLDGKDWNAGPQTTWADGASQ